MKLFRKLYRGQLGFNVGFSTFQLYWTSPSYNHTHDADMIHISLRWLGLYVTVWSYDRSVAPNNPE